MKNSTRNAVLVIDDDPDFRNLIELYGEACNVPVLKAHSCKNGLELLKRDHEKIRTILLDYLMPGMDPARCAASILAAAGKAISVVLVTAAADPAARAAEVRINRWFPKPLEASTLFNLIQH